MIHLLEHVLIVTLSVFATFGVIWLKLMLESRQAKKRIKRRHHP